MPYSMLGYFSGRRKITAILSAPPTTNAIGPVYIIGPNATGDWAGKENRLAIQNGTEWKYVCPDLGLRFYNEATQGYIYNTGNGWVAWPPTETGGGAVGQIDGGSPTSEFGGTQPIDGGGV